MRISLDHAHVFASDVAATVDFLSTMLDARVVWDEEAAGARNVRLRIGHAFVHVYDQPPEGEDGIIHHLGIETDDLDALVAQMQARGFAFRNPIRDYPRLRYVMIAGPDRLLIELFQCHEPQRWELPAAS